MKSFLSTILALLIGTVAALAQGTPTYERGAQVTTEDELVSGKPYILYYVSANGISTASYVKASNDSPNIFQVKNPDTEITDEAFFFFITNGDGTRKIQSRNTSKYFPVPTSNNHDDFKPADDGGSWVLNFLTGGDFAPYYGAKAYSLNRSIEILHAYSFGEGNANRFRIYEIALSTTANTDFTSKEIGISGTAATTLTTDQWYVMKPTASSNYFVDDASGYTTSTAPVISATSSAKYLVQLIAGDNGNYYVETGLGNYLFTNSTSTITTRVSAQQYNATDLTTTWDFYPVTLEDPFSPAADKLYQIKTDANDGVSDRWIFTPTGYGTNQYYLYNTNSQQFAYPTESGSWTLAAAAVPVIIERQIDGHFIIKTKDGTTPFRIGSETPMNIIQDEAPTSEMNSQLTVALNGLIGAYTKITEVSEITDDWYALRIKSDSNNPLYDGNFLYTLETPYDAGRTIEYPYPVGHGGTYNQHPAKNNTTYYFRLWPVIRTVNGVTTTYYHWQLPNGIYIVNYHNNYPIMYHQDLSDFIIGKNDDGTFYIQSSNFRAQAADGYIGKTARKFMESTTKLEIYKKELTDVSLTAWKVIFNDGADDIPLTCTRDDVNGATVAYNGGYFLLPTKDKNTLNDDLVPFSTDFKINNEPANATVDGTNHTIHVVYAPNVCFTEDNLTIVQGSRTTGKGNTMQALLRIEVNPDAPCYPESFTLSTLTGYDQIDKVEAYLTHSEQLHAEGAEPVLLGEQTTLSGNNVTITVPLENVKTATHLMKKGESTYLWITADIKSTAAESATIDASISRITYKNEASNNDPCTISTKGNPDGQMRIFLRQQYVRVSTEASGIESYYRNPALLRNGSDLLAFCEYRYDNVYGLGKDYDNTDYGHHIDVVMRKSTDNGATWGSPVTVAEGTDGDSSTQPSGYANPAVVCTSNGKLICLMTMGSSTSPQHIGYTYSDDGGTTWSTPTDIFSTIDWNGISPASAYVTSGKGVTFSNGRVAFVINAKVSGTTNEYILYSDDEGSTWNVVPSTVFGNGKEGKLEVMNDNSLLVTVSRGNDTPLNGRGYNTTTGTATGDGINTWNTAANWGTNLNSYGCNNDILYFGRSPEAAGIRDAIVHTVVKEYSSKRLKDLRLYVSFDQASSWKEMFTISAGNAATSSLQKLSDGNLAIFFEDGSIGNNEKDGCYALNCAVISNEMMEAQMTDLYTSKAISMVVQSGSNFVDWGGTNTGNWYQKVTTNSSLGIAGVEIAAEENHNLFNREGDQNQRVLVVKPSAANGSDIITITAPDGYIIKSYSITGYNKASGETYTLTAGSTSVNINEGMDNPATLTVNDVYYKTATFTFKSNSSSNTSYANITDFSIELAQEYSVELHEVGGKSYATLFVPFDLQQTDNTTKAYYIREVTSGGMTRLLEVEDNGRKIAHHTAVVLINSEGSTHVSFAVTSNMIQPVDESLNLLKGTLEGETINLTASSNLYSLGRRSKKTGESDDWSEWVAGFYKNGIADFALGANKAYLDTPSSPVVLSGTRGFDLPWDDVDETQTLIDDSKDDTPNRDIETPWYTLDGRKVGIKQPAAKGIYIKNGRKMVIK